MHRWGREALKRLDLQLFGFCLAGVLGCQPGKPAQAGPPPASPSIPAEPAQHEADTQFIDRVYEIASRWDHDATTEHVQTSLAVALAADGDRLVGTSRQWPVVVTFYPNAADRAALLHLAFTDVAGVSLAEVERRFGPPAQQIEAKESLAAFVSQSGARLVVTLLGGTKPTSPVSAIKLEGSGPRKPVPIDLF